jgi:isopenicillin-N epimerase
VRPYSPDSPWDLDPEITFLNHGSYGACPRPVLELQHELTARLEANPIRFLSREFEDRLDEARASIAGFLHADPEGLVAVPNATTGVATVIEALHLRPGDELLTTDHEYNATLNALGTAADHHRARVVRAEIPLPIRHPEQAVEAILAAVTPRTRIALVSHITSPTALVLPIETIVRELDRLGVDTLVDAAHAPGMVPVDVRALGAAYWTGNGHKWLCGPKGTGVLYVREDRRAGMHPLVTSHGRNDPRTDRPPLWKEFDWQGTGDPTAFLALPESVRVIGSLQAGGWEAHMADNRALAVAGRDRLLQALGQEPLAPDSMVGSMASVIVPSAIDPERFSLELAETERIEVPLTPWPVRAARDDPESPPKLVLLRISAQRYNEPGDYDRLADALVRRLGTLAA